MPDKTIEPTDEERAAQCVATFASLEADANRSLVTRMLEQGEQVSRWVSITGKPQGEFPVPKSSQWQSKGAISTLVQAFEHWGVDGAAASERVARYRKAYGSKVSTLTALNGARKGKVADWDRDAKAKAAEAKAKAETRKAKAEEEKAKAESEPTAPTATADQVATILLGRLSELSPETFGALIGACKVEYERREAMARTPEVAAAVQPTRAA